MNATLLVLVLSFPIVSNAQARPASCEVQPAWAIKGGVRSANLEPAGRFQTEGREGQSVHSFKLRDTTLVISAAVDYVFDYSTAKPKPLNIKVAITVSDHENKDIFESLDSSEASTRYTKNWNLSVTKNLFFDNRIYMFTLTCRDGIKRQIP
jgi:hypothetical protein